MLFVSPTREVIVEIAEFSTKALCAVVLLLCSGQAGAGELRRCKFGNGARHYSDAPCPKGSVEELIRTIDADRKFLSEEARRRADDTREWQRRNRDEVAAMVRLQHQAARARRGSVTKTDPCGQARAKRDRIRQREFMTMTFDRAVALDDAVRDVCK